MLQRQLNFFIMSNLAIETRNLTKVYSGNIKAIDN